MAEDRKRLILPAPSTGTPSPSSLSSSQSKKDSATRTSTACEACKRRKSRCVGRPPPCQMCRTCGTECVIDETLDQRRKISAKRLAELADIQREVLLSLVRTIRYGQQNDIQELVRCLRTPESGNVTANFLCQTSSQHRRERRDSEAGLDDLMDAFGALKRDPAKQGTSESRRSSVSISTSPATVKNETLASEQSSPRTPENPSLRDPKDALRRTTDRWSQYFQMKHQPGQMDSASESDYVWTPQGIVTGQQAGLGAMWPAISRSPGLSERAPFFSSFGDRSLWHPVLRLGPESGETVITPTSVTTTEFGQSSHSGPSPSSRRPEEDGNFVEVLRSFPSLPLEQASQTPFTDYTFQLQMSRFAIHSIQPLVRNENSPLSRVITDFRAAGRQFIADGNSPFKVLGSDAIAVDLLLRDRLLNDEYSVSNWASEIWRSFDDWDIFVRLANVLFFVYIMRWTLMPTAEQYSHIPDILKPSSLQCMAPHHAVVDFLPFPILRDGLVKDFRDWMTAFRAAGISTNWSAGLQRAVYQDPNTGHTIITQAFEHHVSNPRNWSIGRSVLVMFPELQNAGINIIDGQ